MEYRCYVIGDAVTEPGALLRRLLNQPFPLKEARALQHHSLLYTRSEEAKGTNAYPMAVSLPNLQEARTAALTLPNPSMPSVDVIVQFAALTDTRQFERVMMGHYNTSGGGRGPSLSSALRHTFSHVSSLQDLYSSEVPSSTSGAHGIALHASPQAIVIAFNPFSMCSFSKLRVEWVHALLVLRQQRQQRVDAAVRQQQQQQQQPQQTQQLRSTTTVFVGAPVPVTPLTSSHAVESVESFPAVLLVATRMELMRETMEATPSVHVPSSLEVTEVAQALQAQAYVEVGTSWDESMDVLRKTIARACMGELTNAPVVSYNMVYTARQASVARAIEEVQMDPYEEDEDGGESEKQEEGRDASSSSSGGSDAEVRREGLVASPLSPDLHAQQHRDVVARADGDDDDGQPRGASAAQERLLDADALHSAAPTSVLAGGETQREGDSPRAASSSVGGDSAVVAAGVAAAGTPMRGRQLRRHLVTALAPLVVPQDAAITQEAVQRQQPHSRDRVPPKAPPSSSAASRWTWRRHPRTSRVFYVRRATGTSQYAVPDDYDGPPVDAEAAAVAAATESGSDAHHAEGGAAAAASAGPPASTGGAHRGGAGGAQSSNVTPVCKDGDKAARKMADVHTPASEEGAPRRDDEGDVEGLATSASTDTEAQCTNDVVDLWRQRQQVQLRRVQVSRLEHQLCQLRLQSTRLRAQSKANADLRRTVSAMSRDLEDKEQAFSSRVAEQNQQLASDVLNTTVAIEALVGVGLPSLTLERKEGQLLGVSEDGAGSSVHECDAKNKEEMDRLHCALARRDAAAEAVKTLQDHRRRVAQRHREVTEESDVLLRRGVTLEEAMLPLQDETEKALAEGRALRELVRALEQQQAAQMHQREQMREAGLAQRQMVESQVRELERLRHVCTSAHHAYASSLRTLGLSSRLRTASAVEENTRVRLSLERATGRLAEALLRGAEALYRMRAVQGEVVAGTRRVAAQRAAQQQRLLRAREAAEVRRAEAVQARYSNSSTTMNSASYQEEDYGSVHRTPLELLTVAVEASAEANEQWAIHDVRVTAPLLDKAHIVEAELQLLLHPSTLAMHHKSISTDPRRAEEPAVNAGGAEDKSWWCWLRENVADVCRSAANHCAEPWESYVRYLATIQPEDGAMLAGRGSPSTSYTSSPSTVRDVSPPSMLLTPPSSVTPTGAAVTGEPGAVLERALWATCDRLVKRLPSLDERFAASYRKMRVSP